MTDDMSRKGTAPGLDAAPSAASGGSLAVELALREREPAVLRDALEADDRDGRRLGGPKPAVTHASVWG
ncbi:MAG TPA: hypothetical protein VL049_18940 [Candidatus Dormibacteraeota bacterium]|nr:hypothetical protein [Candidatus Dormibacteraeota bacterium]